MDLSLRGCVVERRPDILGDYTDKFLEEGLW